MLQPSGTSGGDPGSRTARLLAAGLVLAAVLAGGAAWWRAHQDARPVAMPPQPVRHTTHPTALPTPPIPRARNDEAVAFDPAAGTLLVFGGFSGTLTGSGPSLGDTWAWDGWRWRELDGGSAPPHRGRAGMAYDPALHGIVLAGGQDAGVNLGDTWLWRSDGWHHLWDGGADQPQGPAAMVWDHTRRQLLLLACCQLGTRPTLATWVPGAHGWTRLPGGLGQFPDTPLLVADDPARGAPIAVEDGFDGTGLTQAWTWDGRQWTAVHPATRPVWDPLARLVWDPVSQHVLYLRPGQGGAAATWAWDGRDWIRQGGPVGPDYASMAITIDTGGTAVVFGGSQPQDDYALPWVWSGTDWRSQSHVNLVPAVTGGNALAHDPRTGGAVTFGGVVTSGDTWVWDGAAWSLRHPSASPPPRLFTALADDPGRNRVLLFGGSGQGDVPMWDTWTWDGVTWTQQRPPAHPQPSDTVVMASDPAHGTVVLVAGCCTSQPSQTVETWTWDGRTWTQQHPDREPPDPFGASMAFDAATGRVVYASGADPASPRRSAAQVWAWDGRQWTHAADLPRTAGSLVHLAADGATHHVIALVPTPPSNQSLATFTYDGAAWTVRDTLALHASALGPIDLGTLGMLAFAASVPAADNAPSAADEVWRWDGRHWTLRGL